MKKSKLKIGLVTSFIASMALSACGAEVTKSKDNIVDFTGYGDEQLALDINEIYQEYKESSTGIAKYYDQVMEVLIRHAFAKDKTGSAGLAGIKKNYNQILNEAKDSVKSAKKTAQENASTNGTDYATEWKSVLSEKGVKDEEELLQYFIYQLEKEEIEDWYFDKHEDQLRKEYIGVNADGSKVESKVRSRLPYHVRHILVKVEDGGNDYTRGTITAGQAKLLSETVSLLADGVMSFGEVAKKKSEDSSNDAYGEVDIMTNAVTSGKLAMVNEFQLGIYAYDAIKKNSQKATATEVNKGLGLNASAEKGSNETVKSYFTSRGIVEIPYSVFVELGEVAELEANYKTGLQVEEGKALVYPRNLLWNRYLNNHSIFVITNGAREDNASITGTDRDTYDVTTPTNGYVDSETINVKGKDVTVDYTTLKGFAEEVDGFDDNSRVLCASEYKTGEEGAVADKNKVIIGVRSEFGIHLMIVEKSAYDYDKSKPTLEEYYTTAKPGDSDYPGAPDEEYTTYVNFINTVKNSEYGTRADKVRNAIKGFDSTYEYRLYEELKTGDGINQNDPAVAELFSSIDNYITVQRNKNNDEQDEGIEKVWQTYVELLETQDFYRNPDNLNNNDRILPEGCRIAFNKDTTTTPLTEAEKAAYEEGGRCYVK